MEEIQKLQKTTSDDGNVERWTTRYFGDRLRIYRIKAQVLPSLAGYIHLLLGENLPPSLIDAGSGEGDCPGQILAGLETVNRQFERVLPSDIERIILTHTHVDHFGGVNELKRLTNASVWVHRFESRVVSSYNERATVSNARFASYCLDCGIEPDQVDVVLRGFGFLPGRIAATGVDRVLDDGISDGMMTFHHFPGHSAGGLGIAIGPILFSGDLILSKTLTQIWPASLFPFTGLDRYLDSIDRLAHWVTETTQTTGCSPVIFPGHEEVVTDIPSRIALVKKSTLRRNGRTLDIIARATEPPTADEIARKLYLTSHSSRVFFAICDVGARLEYLQLHGELAVANYEQLPAMQHPVYRWRKV
ncbi:MAG: MBL fold metallo-hydrolase [Planctomycetia bacterium]|nr:MBL fold metallo-hydrolase [Planctomycetia bacterium]